MKQEDTEDIEYQRFLKSAEYYLNKLGVGEIADKYSCSPEYIYMTANGSKPAGRKAQLKFAKACGFSTVGSFIESVVPSSTMPGPQVTQLTGEDIKNIIAGEMSKYNKPVASTTHPDAPQSSQTLHQILAGKFKPDGMGYEINQVLLKIEQKKESKMKKIKRYLLEELQEIEDELQEQKKTTPAKNQGSQEKLA